jgi:hypothetical protein
VGLLAALCRIVLSLIEIRRAGMMKSHLLRLAPCILGTLALAIDPASAQRDVGTTAPTAISETAVAAGYIHDLSRSQFKIGLNATIEIDTPTLRRWRGSFGSWAIDPTNSWSMGILDAVSPHGPYILDEAVHGERVKAYFIKAGLPADQIQDVRTTYEVRGGGPTREVISTPLKLHSINSILTRSVSGIRVVESVAWAKMTTSGDVDMESVFWPPIDKETINRAMSFKRRVSDTAGHAAYLAALPGPVYRDVGVVIHHTDPSVHAAPTSYVAYDATTSPEGYAAVRHFDENGNEFRLPQEQPAPPPPPIGPNRKLQGP